MGSTKAYAGGVVGVGPRLFSGDTSTWNGGVVVTENRMGVIWLLLAMNLGLCRL